MAPVARYVFEDPTDVEQDQVTFVLSSTRQYQHDHLDVTFYRDGGNVKGALYEFSMGTASGTTTLDDTIRRVVVMNAIRDRIRAAPSVDLVALDQNLRLTIMIRCCLLHFFHEHMGNTCAGARRDGKEAIREVKHWMQVLVDEHFLVEEQLFARNSPPEGDTAVRVVYVTPEEVAELGLEEGASAD